MNRWQRLRFEEDPEYAQQVSLAERLAHQRRASEWREEIIHRRKQAEPCHHPRRRSVTAVTAATESFDTICMDCGTLCGETILSAVQTKGGASLIVPLGR